MTDIEVNLVVMSDAEAEVGGRGEVGIVGGDEGGGGAA